MAYVLQSSSSCMLVLWVERRWEVVSLYSWFELERAGGKGRVCVAAEINGSSCPQNEC